MTRTKQVNNENGAVLNRVFPEAGPLSLYEGGAK